MAKVFADTNCFVGLANSIPEIDTEHIHKHQVFVSVLSIHILFYVNKIKAPDSNNNNFINDFNILSLDLDILENALTGPTQDLEDNIQLHSCTKANCEIFVTFDKKLLAMKYFGKARILTPQDLESFTKK